MRKLTSFLCAVILCVTASIAAYAQSNAEKLIGLWFQDVGTENLVRFTAEKKVTLFLRKGEIGDLHSLDGVWTLDADSAITMTFSVREKTFTQRGKLSFEGDAMIITDPKGEPTHHRRHTGPLPAWAQW